MAVNIPVRTPGAPAAIATLTSLRGIAQSLIPIFGVIGLGRLFVSSIGLMKEFELTMARVRGISGATDQEFKSLSQTARTLGATTIFSARQAAQGMTFLAQAGFSANEIISATAASLTLAQAGSLELAAATDLTAKTIRQFGLDADQAGRIADVFAKAGASSNTSVTQLGEALKFVGPVARGVNVSLEETVAVIGALGDAGIQGSMAGTALRQIISTIQRPTSAATATLKQFGIEIADITALQGDLTAQFELLTPVLQNVAATTAVFGKRQLAAALTIGKSVERIKELNTTLLDSEDFAREFAALVNNTLSGAFLSLRSGIEEAALQFGDSGFLGVLTETIKVIAGAVSVLNGMSKEFIENTMLTYGQIQAMKALATTIRILTTTLVILSGRFVILQSLNLITYFIGIGRAALVAGSGLRAFTGSLGGIATLLSGLLFFFGTQETEVLNQSVSRWQVWGVNIRAVYDGIKGVFSGAGFLDSFNQSVEEGLEAIAGRSELQDLANNFRNSGNEAEAAARKIQALNDETADLIVDFRVLNVELGGNDAVEFFLGQLREGLISLEDAAIVVETLRNLGTAFASAQKGVISFDRSVNPVNQSVEQLTATLSNLRKEEELYNSSIESLNKSLTIVQQSYFQGAISAKEFGEESQVLVAQAGKLTDNLKELQGQFNRTNRTLENKIKDRSVQIIKFLRQLESLGNSIIDLFNGITDALEQRTATEESVNQLRTDRDNLLGRRSEEIDRGDEADRSAIATYDTEILSITRQINDGIFRLNTELSDFGIVRNNVGDALDATTGALRLISGGIPSFQTGGIVRGTGATLARVHGGEAIFNPRQLNNLGNLISGSRQNQDMTISVTNETRNDAVLQVSSVRNGSRGNLEIEAVIRDAVSNEIESGSFDVSMKRRYALDRRF